MEYTYRAFDQLSVHQLYDLLQLRNEVFVIEQDCIYQDADGKDKQSFHLLAHMEDELVAYCRIVPEGISYEGYCSIGRVVNSKNHRGQGIGVALMKKAIEICQRQFEHPIKLSGQCYLEKFYKDLGFEVVSEQYLEDDIPHYAMVYRFEA